MFGYAYWLLSPGFLESWTAAVPVTFRVKACNSSVCPCWTHRRTWGVEDVAEGKGTDDLDQMHFTDKRKVDNLGPRVLRPLCDFGRFVVEKLADICQVRTAWSYIVENGDCKVCLQERGSFVRSKVRQHAVQRVDSCDRVKKEEVHLDFVISADTCSSVQDHRSFIQILCFGLDILGII